MSEQNGAVPTGDGGEDLTEDQQIQAGIDQGTLEVNISLVLLHSYGCSYFDL